MQAQFRQQMRPSCISQREIMMSPEKIAAQRQLENAIENMVDVFGSFSRGEIQVGWVLVVCGARQVSKEYDEYDDETDDEEMVSRYCGFTPRSQQPTMSRGMMEAHLDRYRNR